VAKGAQNVTQVRTCTGCALDAVPLLLGYASKMAPVAGLAPTRTGLKGRALGSLHSRAKKDTPAPTRTGTGHSSSATPFIKRTVLLYTTGAKLI